MQSRSDWDIYKGFANMVVERDYPNVFKRFIALGPLMNKVGNGGKGIAWNTQTEVKQLGELSGLVSVEGVSFGMPKIETNIDACEVILQLAPETNGHVAVKAWQALGKPHPVRRDAGHGRGAAAQPRRDLPARRALPRRQQGLHHAGCRH